MYQTPMAVWNEIAKAQPLSQPGATLFRMTPEELQTGLATRGDKPAEARGADNKTAAGCGGGGETPSARGLRPPLTPITDLSAEGRRSV